MKTAVKVRGRPRSNPLTRPEQLRQAKRLQRERERAAGFTDVQLKLPEERARKLIVALRSPEFVHDLDRLVDAAVVDVRKYEQLATLAWNRADPFVPARDAFGLYERNWRFVSMCRTWHRQNGHYSRI